MRPLCPAKRISGHQKSAEKGDAMAAAHAGVEGSASPHYPRAGSRQRSSFVSKERLSERRVLSLLQFDLPGTVSALLDTEQHFRPGYQGIIPILQKR